MNTSLVYVTTTDPDDAEHIGKVLVTERLAASVNIVGDVRSIYRWKEAIFDKKETLLFAKTSTRLVNETIERIRSIHKYECPCIVTWRLDDGNDAYLDWIVRETT